MIDKIGNRCTGCYACISKCPRKCIHMEDNAEGFWFPVINAAKCIGCNLCEKACPVLNPIPNHKTEKDIKVYALTHKDETIREKSSSGGAFSSIAEYVLKRGGVVFGAAFTDTYDVAHLCVDKPGDLWKLRGSKYVQSRIGNTFQEAEKYLKEGRLVLFSGTACQTSGLIGYLGRDYENLITQDLICHGVPSPMVWRRYLKFRENIERSPIKDVSFRNKALGWHSFALCIKYENGTSYINSQKNDMMIRAFLHGKCSRECCYQCDFKQKYRLADFTLADFWGIQDIAPELDDNRGISSCYVNSEKARQVLQQIKDSVNLHEMDLDRAVEKNPAMIKSEEKRTDRHDFLMDIRKKPFDVVAGKYIDHDTSISSRTLWAARRMLGNYYYEKLKSILKRRH